MVEPWLRGTLTEVDAVRRQVLHALELAGEDVERWCAGLSDAEMNARPYGIAPVAFHLRHIARSLDRLLTYAEGKSLSGAQRDALGGEMERGAAGEAVMAEVRGGLDAGRERILMLGGGVDRFGVEEGSSIDKGVGAGGGMRTSAGSYEEPRGVGRAMLPSTLGGLMVHCAEHTQRHVGQAVTTAKVVIGMLAGSGGV